jgi:hypothetical protein
MIGEAPVQTILPGTRVISNRAAATLAVAALCFFVPSAMAGFSNGALTAFLSGHIAPEASEFGEIRMTRNDVASWMQKARTARLPHDRGIAIANLQNCAWVLVNVPGARPAAIELLNQWVLPNVTLLRSQPRTSACSYEHVVMGAYACYKQAGDAQGERRVLELLSTQARDPGASRSRHASPGGIEGHPRPIQGSNRHRSKSRLARRARPTSRQTDRKFAAEAQRQKSSLTHAWRKVGLHRRRQQMIVVRARRNRSSAICLGQKILLEGPIRHRKTNY